MVYETEAKRLTKKIKNAEKKDTRRMSVEALPKTPEGATLDIYVGPSRKMVFDPKAVPVTLKVNISRKGWEDPAYRYVVLEDLADMIVTALENAE